MHTKSSLKERIAITTRGFGLIKKYCPGLISSKTILVLVQSLKPFLTVWLSVQIINEIANGRRMNRLVMLTVIVLMINFLVSLLLNGFEKVYNEKESQMWGYFRKIFSDKLMTMDYADLLQTDLQNQRKQAEENLFMFGNGLGQLVWSITGLVRSSVTILLSIVMAVPLFIQRSGNRVMDSPLWAVVLLAGVLIGGMSNSKATVQENNIFVTWCKDSVWFHRAFSFFGRDLYMSQERAKDVRLYEQNFLADAMIEKLSKKEQEGTKKIFLMAFYPALASIVVGLSQMLCWLFVASKSYLGAFGVGSIVWYVGVLAKLGEGLQEMMFAEADNQVYCTYLQELYSFLDIPSKKYNGCLPVEKRAFCDDGDNDYCIEFQDVSFKYPGEEEYSLRHVSLTFKNGKRLALVGMNGSGKTTFIKLLCRLYDPTEGVILLNGIDIKKYNYDEYAAIFSVVFQDFSLFANSIGQNVAAQVDVDSLLANKCLAEAGFLERLEQLPKGLDTFLYKDIDETGIEPSGGEAQKIALARALYKHAPFIVLDEPTAALDPIAEQEIYEKFNTIAGSKTVVYISHRLSSCRFCDSIVVFDHGKIIERGTHEKLIEHDGVYRTLWNAQAQYYVN